MTTEPKKRTTLYLNAGNDAKLMFDFADRLEFVQMNGNKIAELSRNEVITREELDQVEKIVLITKNNCQTPVNVLPPTEKGVPRVVGMGYRFLIGGEVQKNDLILPYNVHQRRKRR